MTHRDHGEPISLPIDVVSGLIDVLKYEVIKKREYQLAYSMSYK